MDTIELLAEISVLKERLKNSVEVVRCKDCTYWNEAKVNSKGFLICHASGMEITEMDYCSYGERREE